MKYKPAPHYLFSPAFNTPEIREAIESFLPKWIEKHDPEENTQIYHYTTLSGLRGILKDRALWYGHMSSFNDPLEVQYGKNVFNKVMNDIMEKEKDDNVRILLKQFLVQVEAFGKHLFHPFAVCFCQSGNLLSQWRAYADKGGGYCLGFLLSSDTKISCNLNSPKDRNYPFLRKVIYDEKEQRQLISQYLEIIIEGTKNAFKKGYRHVPSHHTSMIVMQSVSVILDMLICFKQAAFEEENEWRLVHVTHETFQPECLKFRESDRGLVPYRPTYIFDEEEKGKFKFPVQSIIIGPSLEPIGTKSAIELLLNHISIDNHPIKFLPYEIQIKDAGYRLR